MRELGLLATHGFIKNPGMYKWLSSSHVMDEHHHHWGRVSVSIVGRVSVRGGVIGLG